MNVQTYLFQSPYTSSVQVGRPDPSSKPDESSASSSSVNTSEADTQVKLEQPVSPVQEETVNTELNQLLDVYA